MSQTIDNQIVKMQFDNASFEKNVQQSMSTLDKLKKALKFDKVDMSPLQNSLDNVNVSKVSSACDAVTNKFSLLGTIGDQVIRDLTSKFTSAAERMVKSFTVDQVASGWEKYAQKTTAVQTIMANTIGEVGEGLKWKDQAEQMAAITEQIEKLNWFTDETSYSLTDMTNNIGKFVAQKVPLEEATRAMMGISAWAAVSGQTKTQAEMAMYNLSQSLGAGAVKAIDWKSIENANMATAEFKETVIEMAKALGVLDKETGVINEAFITAAKYKGPDAVTIENFRDTLSSGWFNKDVLMGALNKYGGFSEKINELYNVVNREGMVSTTSALLKTLEKVRAGTVDADKEIAKLAKNAKMSTGDLKALFSELAGDEYDLGRRAFAAAQEAKTFQEAIDATADAVASEWMGIFEAIFGNYVEAKELWTDLSNSLWDIFAGPLDNLKWALIEWKDTEVSVRDEVNGGWKKMKGRDILLEAVATAISNIGDALEVVRSALAEVFPIFNLFVTEGEDAFDTSEGAEGIMRFTLALREWATQLKLSEESASALHTIVKLLATGVKVAFTVIGTAIHGVSMLIRPIFNILDALFGLIGKIITAITGNNSVTEFSDKLAAGGDKIRSKYYAVMEKVAEVLNKIADAIRGIPESKVIRKIGESFRNAKNDIVNFWNAFKEMPVIQQMIKDFNTSVENIKRKISPVVDSVEQSLEGLKRSVASNLNLTTLNNALTVAYNKVTNFVKIIKDFALRIKDFFKNLKDGKSLVESFKESFGDIIDRVKELKENLKNFFEDLFSKGDELGGKFDLEKIQKAIHDFVTNITPEQVTMIAVAGTFMLIAINMLRLSEAMRNAVEAFTGIGVALKNVINSYVKKQKSTILQVAEAIVIVAASLWVLSTVPRDKLEAVLGAVLSLGILLGALTGVLTACGIALHAFGGQKSMVELATGLVFVAGAFMTAALSLKVLEYVNLEGILPKLAVMALVMGAMVALSLVMGKLDKFNKGSLTMIAAAGSLLIAAEAMRRIGQIPNASIDKAMDAMLKIMVGIAAIAFASGKIGIFSAVGLIAIVMTIDKLLPSLEKIVNYDYTKIQDGLSKNEAMLKKLGGVLIVMTGIGMLAGNRIKGVGIAMLSLAATFGIMLGVAKLAGQMRPSELAQGEKFLWHMAGIISLIEAFSSKSRLQMFGGKNGGEGTKAFTRIAIAMGILLGVAKLASMMDAKDLIKGELAVAGLGLIVMGMTRVAKDCQNSQGVIKAVSAMIFAVSLILAEVALLSMIPLGNMLPAFAAILSIIGALSLLAFAITHNLKPLQEGQKINVAGMAAFISAMVAVVATGIILNLLSKKPIDNVKGAATGIIAVIGAIALLSAALGKVGGNSYSKKQLQTFAGSVLMVAIAAAILAGLTQYMQRFNLDPNTMLKAAGSIAIVLVGLVPALLALNKFGAYTGDKENGGNYKKMITAVGLAVGALVAVGITIGALSRLGGDPNSMLAAATSLAIGLIAVCAPLIILGFVGKKVTDINVPSMVGVVLGAIAALGTVAAAIITVSNLGNPDTMIQSATALAIGLVAISVPIAVLGAVGKLCENISGKGLGAMAIAAVGAIVSLAAVAGILVWFSQSIDSASLNILNQSIPILATAIGGVAVLAVAIAAAGLISGGNFAGVLAGGLAMIEAIGIIGLIVLAISGLGALLNKFEGLKKGLITGLDFLVIIAGKIGEATGALIGGIGTGLTSQLVPMAENLNKFSEKMITFSENIKSVDNEVVTSCGNLAKAMLYITASEFLDGITRLMGVSTGGFNFSALGTAISDFCMSVKDIPEDAVTKASVCSVIAKRLAELSDNINLSGGWIQKIIGEKDMSSFAKGMSDLGSAILSFCNSVKGLPENAAALAKRAADTAVPMVELSKTLYGSGGWVQKIMGEKNLGDFGTNLTSFATSLKGFVKELVAIEQISPTYDDLIRRCADAMAPMVDLASGIQNAGGWLAKLVGENTLDIFGETLIPFANDLRIFVNRLNSMASEVPNYNQLIVNVVACTKHLVNLANGLENMGGVGSWFSGDNTLSKFGETLVGFGESLSAYATSISGVDIGMIESANTGITELVQLGAMASGVRADAFSGLKLALEECSKIPVTTVANEIVIGTPIAVQAVTDLFNGMLGIMTGRINEDVARYTEYGKQLVLAIKNGILRNYSQISPALNTMVNYIKNYLATNMAENKWLIYGRNIVIGIKNGVSRNYTLIGAALNAMITYIKTYLGTNMSEDKWTSYGKNVVEGIKTGINDNYSSISNSLSSMVSSIKDYLDNNVKSSDYEDYGKYIAKGVAKGIDDNAEKAVKAAKDMVDAINAEIEKVEEINSPSKVTYEYGKYIVLGISNGIRDYTSEAVASTNEMAKEIVDNANTIISLITEAINTDIDSQPTIRPVLDTSDIDNKAKFINRMFNDADLALAYKASREINDIAITKANVVYGNAEAKDSSDQNPQQINFTQNNYSPKALNRYEIYRQTNNQIRQLKGALS